MSRRMVALSLALVFGCSAQRLDQTAASGGAVSVTVRSPDGASLGVLRLEPTAGGVHITGTLSDLAPGAHGMHFHAVGRCDGSEFTVAGAHFNPAQAKHGLANPEGPHAGDLPAIAANASGVAAVDAVTRLVTLDERAATGLLDRDGASLVLHAANDDQRTDPSGNSGARIACGVVGGMTATGR